MYLKGNKKECNNVNTQSVSAWREEIWGGDKGNSRAYGSVSPN